MDPKCKCKKVNGTKIAEQKLVGTLGHWVTGTPSASAKRSAEQKWQNKNYSLFRVTQTKIGGNSASAKRSVEQKLVGRTKKRSAEQKLVSGTKTAEQKLVGGTKKDKQSKNW